MKKWYNEEYEFEIEVTGFLRGDHTEHYCRNLLCKKRACEKNESFFIRPFVYRYNSSYIS